MKKLLPLAIALALVGCTASPDPPATSPAPANSSATTPRATPTAWKDIPAAPTKPSSYDVVLSDRKLFIADGDVPYCPGTFAGAGNRVLLDDPDGNGILIYTDGHRTGRADIDTDEDGVDDMLLDGSVLYVSQTDLAEESHRRIHVYDWDESGRLTPVAVLDHDLPVDPPDTALHLTRNNLVDEGVGGPVLVDGPGPLAEPIMQLEKKLFTVELPGAEPLRIQTHYGAGEISVISVDDEYAYYLVYDYDLDSSLDEMAVNVYRVALTDAGTNASYTLRTPESCEPMREVQVWDGHLYQLYDDGNTVQLLLVHPNS